MFPWVPGPEGTCHGGVNIEVADLVLAMEVHAEEIFVNHSFSTGPLQGRRANHHQECVQAGGL